MIHQFEWFLREFNNATIYESMQCIKKSRVKNNGLHYYHRPKDIRGEKQIPNPGDREGSVAHKRWHVKNEDTLEWACR